MSKQKKSIIAHFGLLSAAVDADPGPPERTPPAPPLPRVGAGVIGAAQRSIGELRDERDRLKALVDSGAGASVDLDVALIEPSPFPDRLPDDDDAADLAFKASVEAEGQKIPIQVRPHPTAPGRYQVVYGHRRLKAAREIGRTVRALVVEMTDRDLVVSQGIENAARQDLTWIERALFAARMDDARIRPRDIKAALAIDDAELARMRGVCRALPREIIGLIGRAAKVGRPRWGDFARLYATKSDAEVELRRLLSSEPLSRRASDERFQAALSFLKDADPPVEADRFQLRDNGGRDLARIRVSANELRITPIGERGASFSAFLQAELPRLIATFVAQEKD